MVRIHAQTIRPATPQRTADSRLIEPTPMIAPVIVCVVLTGTPRCVAVKSEIAPAVSAAKPPTGCSLVIFDPIVWMMRQPPDSVPERDRGVRRQDDPERNRMPSELEIAAGEQHAGDDPHRLLRVVAAVAQAVGRGRQQLQPPEPVIDAAGRRPRERPEDRHHQQEAEAMPISGASTMKMSVFVQPEAMIAPQPALATAAPA